MLLLLFLSLTAAESFKFKPRCNVDFFFNGDLNQQNRKSWQRNCSQNVEVICKKNITISYFSMLPFIDDETIGADYWPVAAVLQQIISAALSQCCGNCLKITFNKVGNRTQLTDINTKAKSDILYPMFTQGVPNRMNTTRSPLTIPIIKLSTAMFITALTIPPKLFAIEVLQAIYDLWPLFGVAIMLAFGAGVVMWFLDTWYNKDQLPRRFIPGSFEGFWWSFVSMTTVGYGDVAPSSALAKLFAMFWILCGITITALMTAALTTAINEVSNRHKASVDSGNIGILNNHVFEKVLLMKGNAKQYYMNTVEELIENMKSKNNQPEISGFLVDFYTAKKYLQKQMKSNNNNLFVRNVVNDVDQSYYGIAIYDEYLYDLINEYIEYQRDIINEFVYDMFNNLPDISSPIIEANLLFTTESGIYEQVLICCASMIAFFLCFGALYELCSLKLKATRINSNFNKASSTKEEIRIEEEMKALTKKWKKTLKTKLPEFILDGTFTVKHNEEPNISLTIKDKEDTKKDEKQVLGLKKNTSNLKKKKLKNKNSNRDKQTDFHIFINGDPDKTTQKRPLPQLQIME